MACLPYLQHRTVLHRGVYFVVRLSIDEFVDPGIEDGYQILGGGV